MIFGNSGHCDSQRSLSQERTQYFYSTYSVVYIAQWSESHFETNKHRITKAKLFQEAKITKDHRTSFT